MTVALAALFGLAFGSFANAAIDRIPRRASLNGRSRCDACSEPLAAADLIPVLSYIALRGRCRRCDAPIGVRTPLVETGCALGFAAAFATLAPPVAIAPCCVLVGAVIGSGAIVVSRSITR